VLESAPYPAFRLFSAQCSLRAVLEVLSARSQNSLKVLTRIRERAMSDEQGQRRGLKDIRDSSSAANQTPSQETLRLYEFGPFHLDPVERKLLRGNEMVVLTPKAFDTLVLLVRNSGRLLGKDELLAMLWPDSFVEEGSLSNNIFLLRRALGEDPAFIETVPRRGYRFVGAVRQFPRTAPASSEKLPEVSGPGTASVLVKARRSWRSRAVLGIAGAAVLATLAAAGWFYGRSGRGRETIDSLAVLPFVNSNGDPNTEYLSDGITESLINSLSQLPNLKVMSRDSVFRYKGKETDAQTVGRELGVRAIFKGRVTQRGDTLNISAELIDARDSRHIWGQQYDRKLADMVALREEIAREMASALRRRLTGAEEKLLTKSYTANPGAYQDYLKGRFWWNKQTVSAGNRQRSCLCAGLFRFVRLLQLPGRRFYSSEGRISESQGCRAEGLGA
jgi:TolB-like protein/DNA-binding winged helix-turn-helix (wHTH) protein